MATNAPIGRPRRSRLYIIAGITLAVLAFLAAAGLASAPYLFPASTSGTKVVVAKTAIAARTRIDASELTLSVITPVPPQSFTSISAVAGKAARVDIPSDLPVTANLIVNAPDLLSSSDVAYLLLNNAVLKYELESSKDYETAPTAPDPSCQSVISAGGVGPKQVDSKWKFPRP